MQTTLSIKIIQSTLIETTRSTNKHEWDLLIKRQDSKNTKILFLILILNLIKAVAPDTLGSVDMAVAGIYNFQQAFFLVKVTCHALDVVDPVFMVEMMRIYATKLST